jgi:hypothetical protein
MLILAIILVYAVMASQYESLRDPFIIMFSVPLAAIGVVLALKLTGTTFSLQAYIGVIMLAGIVVSNAILLVDYTNTLRRRDGMAAARGGRDGRPHAAAAHPDDDARRPSSAWCRCRSASARARSCRRRWRAWSSAASRPRR